MYHQDCWRRPAQLPASNVPIEKRNDNVSLKDKFSILIIPDTVVRWDELGAEDGPETPSPVVVQPGQKLLHLISKIVKHSSAS